MNPAAPVFPVVRRRGFFGCWAVMIDEVVFRNVGEDM